MRISAIASQAAENVNRIYGCDTVTANQRYNTPWKAKHQK